MMPFAVAYVAFLVAFGICDAIWLTTVGSRLYKPALGDLLLDKPRLIPAAMFYFGFGLAVVYFAVLPALRDGGGSAALLQGALIGLLAFATYDLTNYATLRPWTLTITLADLAYGTIVVGACSWIAHWVVSRLVAAGWV